MLEVADEDGICCNFLEHGGCHRLDRGKCPFKHGENENTALSADEHTAVINYAETHKKQAWDVKLSDVVADGGISKWKNVANAAVQARGAKMFLVLQKRQANTCVYKEAMDYI
jgi:hypothetical protein